MHTGILKSTSVEEIVLSSTDGAIVKIAVDEIDQRRASQVSVMPEGIEDLISKQEFLDLIAYFQNLREWTLKATRSSEIPDEIGVLTKTCSINPFPSCGALLQSASMDIRAPCSSRIKGN